MGMMRAFLLLLWSSSGAAFLTGEPLSRARIHRCARGQARPRCALRAEAEAPPSVDEEEKAADAPLKFSLSGSNLSRRGSTIDQDGKGNVWALEPRIKQEVQSEEE